MEINEAVDKLNNSGKHRVSKGTVFDDSVYCWQGLSENYKLGDKLTPRNSTLTLFFTERQIIEMARML